VSATPTLRACALLVTLAGCTDCPTGARILSFEQIDGPTACPIEPIPVEVHDGQLQLADGRDPSFVTRVDGSTCEYRNHGALRRSSTDGGVAEEEVEFDVVLAWDGNGEAQAEAEACRTVFDPFERCCGIYTIRASK